MPAISTTLELIRQKLNGFLQRAAPENQEWVTLTNLVDHEGNALEQTKNRVVMSLIHIRPENRVVSTYDPVVPSHTSAVVWAPPLYIDLYVHLYANFSDKNYSQGLVMISETISFFQQHPVFTDENLPGLDTVTNKLTFEMVSLDFADLNYLMGLLGAKYLPSVYYKVRLIPFINDARSGEPSQASDSKA